MTFINHLIHRHHGVAITSLDASMTIDVSAPGLVLAALLVLIGKGH